MSHHHSHSSNSSGCGHSHAPTSFHTAFAVGVALNSIFVIVELIAGHMANSLALIADAVHNLGDVMGLIVAWIGYYFADRAPSQRFTFGFGRVSIFATVFNGAFLVLSSFWIILEAIERWSAPQHPVTSIVMVVAFIGILINAGTAVALMRGQHDINIKGAFLHMIGDAAVSAAVIIAAIVIYYTNWNILDPILSVLVAILVLWSGWPLLLEGGRLAIDAIPNSLDKKAIETFMTQFPGVKGVHDLRIWATSTTKTALSAHILIIPEQDREALLHTLRHALQHEFPLNSVTLQIEQDHGPCEKIH